MNDFPRLAVEIEEPPAPFRFEPSRAGSNPGREAGLRQGDPITDSVEMAENALSTAQNALDVLAELTGVEPLPFPGRDAGRDPDDDGPRAA